MPFFNLRKRGSPAGGSPAVTPAEALPVPITPPAVPTIRLRVAMDPLPASEQPDKELFYIDVNPDLDVNAIRRAVSERLGNGSFSIFKVRWDD